MGQGQFTADDVDQQPGQFTAADVGTPAPKPKTVPQGTPRSAMDRFMDMIPQGAVNALHPLSTPQAIPTLGRMAAATGGAVGGAIAAIPQAYLSAPTQHEEDVLGIQANRLNPNFAVQRMGLQLSDQIQNAAKFYAGNSPDKIGKVLENAPEGIGAGAGTVIGGKLMAKGLELGQAEGDPNALYRKYLDPVADTKAELPEMTPRVRSALVSKVSINHPDVAARMSSGETTLGDLDTIRQVANSSSQAMFKQTGGLPTEMNRGLQNAAGSIRDVLYPAIEQAHGLEPGSLAPIKALQGDLLSASKPPKFGYNPVTWPAKAATRFGLMPAERALTDLKTRAIAAGMPEPTGEQP